MSTAGKTEAKRFLAFLLAEFFRPRAVHLTKSRTITRRPVRVGARIRVCPGGHHAWFESDVGPVRKPWRG